MNSISQAINKERWRQIILEANNSDRPKIEFIHEHHISENAFYYWQRIFRQEAIDNAGVPSAAVAACDSSQAMAASSSFVELSMPIEPAPTAQTPARTEPDPTSNWAMMLQHNGYNLFMDNNVSAQCLKTVLRVINHA